MRGPQHSHTSTGSTKGTLTMLTKAMAMELGPHKVGTAGRATPEGQVMDTWGRAGG